MPVLTFDPSLHPEITYDDAFLVPYNSTEERIRAAVSSNVRDELDDLIRNAKGKESAADPEDPETLNASLAADKAYRSRILELADQLGIGDIKSRDSMDFKPLDGFGNTPIVVANMNQVTGKRMAEMAAMLGGTAALPQDMDEETIAEIAEYMHSRNIDIATPVVIKKRDRLHELKRALGKRNMDTAVVIDDDGKLVGVIGNGEMPRSVNEDIRIEEYMRTSHVTTTPAGTDLIDAYELLEEKNADILPVIDNDGMVVGVHTKKTIASRLMFEPHVNPNTGGLAVLGTVGAINKNPLDRARFLMDQQVRGIVLDTAHADQGIVAFRNLERIRDIAEKANVDLKLIMGNVVTAEAVRSIFAAGGDVAKVGIGPGAMCTTRMETATGRPQLSAVLECSEVALKKGKHIWADGGIKYPRDVDLALAGGASQVMIGSLFTATDESPGAWEPPSQQGGKRSKRNSGMASRDMASLRSNNIGNKRRQIIEAEFGPRSEGVSNVRLYEQTGKPSVADYYNWIIRGLTSSMTYAGAEDLDEYRRFARIGIQQPSGFNEGKPVGA